MVYSIILPGRPGVFIGVMKRHIPMSVSAFSSNDIPYAPFMLSCGSWRRYSG